MRRDPAPLCRVSEGREAGQRVRRGVGAGADTGKGCVHHGGRPEMRTRRRRRRRGNEVQICPQVIPRGSDTPWEEGARDDYLCECECV